MAQSELYGYSGKILRIELTTGETSIEPTARYARDWLGGSGLAQWLLYNEVGLGKGRGRGPRGAVPEEC
jgi:aldehyde:ferredoxin oxidoreductase